MTTSFAVSTDGTRIAYEVQGSGPPLVLLHGGFQSRKIWQPHCERLAHDFCLIAMDIRGHGESSQPLDPHAYTTTRHCEDVLAVADACGVNRFSVWGYSYGANIGRYLAASSRRVLTFVMTGVPFGEGAIGSFRQRIVAARDRWTPILQAQVDGNLDRIAMTDAERSQLASGRIPLILAWMTAMLEWPEIGPQDLLCPTLWLVGSRNEEVMSDARARAQVLRESRVQLHVLDDKNHEQELADVDIVVGMVSGFLMKERCMTSDKYQPQFRTHSATEPSIGDPSCVACKTK